MPLFAALMKTNNLGLVPFGVLLYRRKFLRSASQMVVWDAWPVLGL